MENQANRTQYVIKTASGFYYREGFGSQWTFDVSQAHKYEFVTMANRDAIFNLDLADFTVELV